MSSRANKMEKQAIKNAMPSQETKIIGYRIDVEIAGEGTKTTYMQVTGVPKDLPAEYEETVKRSAEAQFANAINQRLFLEFYNQGKTSKDEQPMFINLSRKDWIQVKEIIKID